MHAMEPDDLPSKHVGGVADDRTQCRGARRRATPDPPRPDRHAASAGDERPDDIGDLSRIVMAVRIEGDEEVAIAVAQQVIESGQLRAPDSEVEAVEHLDLETQPGRLVGGDRGGVVGTRVVDQQHVELDPRSVQDRGGFFDLGQHRADRGAAVVRGEHDRAAQLWHLGTVPPPQLRVPAAPPIGPGLLRWPCREMGPVRLIREEQSCHVSIWVPGCAPDQLL